MGTIRLNTACSNFEDTKYIYKLVDLANGISKQTVDSIIRHLLATHNMILVGCSPWGRWESDTTERLHFHFSLSCNGKGNGNPLQCSCLENPREREAWWAAIYGVAQSRTLLK